MIENNAEAYQSANHSKKFPLHKTKETTFATHDYANELHENQRSVSMKLNQINLRKIPSIHLANISKQSLTQRKEVFC